MLDLRKSDPNFDFDLEVLTMVPKEPAAVPIRDMAEDFALDGQVEVVKAIKRLNKAGFGVFTHHANGARSVSVRRAYWMRVQIAADHYWQSVYGEKSASLIA